MCPFGSLFRMLCLAAHLGAAAGGQTRTWVPSLPVAFFLQEDAHVAWANDVDDEPTVGRDSGDSDCSGPPRTPPPLFRCMLLRTRTHNRFASYLRLVDHQRAASPTGKLLTEGYLGSNIQFYGTSTGVSPFISPLSSLQREGRGQSS